VGNADDPAPNAASFATLDDFINYIYANNNITWRNFNVVGPGPHPIKFPFGEFIPLRFLITGAWDEPRAFALETQAELPEGSRLALQVPHWIGRGLIPAHPQLEEKRHRPQNCTPARGDNSGRRRQGQSLRCCRGPQFQRCSAVYASSVRGSIEPVGDDFQVDAETHYRRHCLKRMWSAD
jgi:hypothetical protein